MKTDMRAVFEIRLIAVLNCEDAQPPTRLTVAYQSWLHMRRLQVALALVPLEDGVHATRAAGKITLVQKFPAGRGPVFSTRIRGGLRLELRLSTRWCLRTRGWATVDDLLSRTKQGLAKIPFEVRTGRRVEKAFVQVAQVSPEVTPDPESVYPLRFLRPREVSPYVTFPPQTRPPSTFQVKQLVDAMLGPPTDKTDWSKPFIFSSSTLTVQSTTPPSFSDTHRNSDVGSMSVNGVSATVQMCITKRAGPNASQNCCPQLPRENSSFSQRRVRDDIPSHAPQHSAFQQLCGAESNDDSANAPEASREEVDYAYVKLWENVFGES